MNKNFTENQLDNIKNKEIYFMFEEFNFEFGGVTNTVIKRANYLADNGYNVTLLTVDTMKNFDYICRNFQKSSILSSNVKFLNIFDYCCKRNTISKNPKYTLNDDSDKNDEYNIEKINNNDNSISLHYYDSSNKLIKAELYIDGILTSVENRTNNKTEYYTPDGFKYLEGSGYSNYTLYNRNSETLKFKMKEDFLHYVIDEICKDKDKPFLVCDSTTHWYNMNAIKSDVYKIGVLHGNPYIVNDETTDHINKQINHISHLDDLEVVVVLTNEVKQDLINEVKQDKFVVIPNFMPDELMMGNLASKETNKIRIFSRISPEKQIADAINAFSIVSNEKPDALLEIYGRALANAEKTELENLKKLIRELNLEDKVILKGFIDDVTVEMQKSLCTLFTSKHEGLPMALLESMANATPVISYDFKYAPKDVISNGIDGIIVKKGDINQLAKEMIRLLDNPQNAIEMGLKAREKIKSNFSTQQVGQKWETLLQDVFINSMINDLNRYKNDNEKLKKQIKTLQTEKSRLKKENELITNSNSWKVTKPLRKITNTIKK